MVGTLPVNSRDWLLCLSGGDRGASEPRGELPLVNISRISYTTGYA